MRHCEVRDGLLVMKMSSMLFYLVGVVIIRSVWVVRSMSKKRFLMSVEYECPCMVHFCRNSYLPRDDRLPDLPGNLPVFNIST